MGLNQEYGGKEHSSAATTLETDIHGKLAYFIKIDEIDSQLSVKPVKVGGSARPVAWSQPEGDLPELMITIRKSGLLDFEQKIRQAKGMADGADVAVAGVSMHFSLISEPFDPDSGAALPTQVRKFDGIYLGAKSGSDRGSSDPLTVELKVQQTTPGEET